MRRCSKPDCTRKHYAKGLCLKHYYRQRHKHERGTPEGDRWYRSRLATGHEWSTVPGTRGSRMPTLKPEPEHIQLDQVDQEASYELDLDEIETNIRRSVIRQAVQALPRRLCTVLELRYGFYDKNPATLDEIGCQLGITRERARQLETEALMRLDEEVRSARQAPLPPLVPPKQPKPFNVLDWLLDPNPRTDLVFTPLRPLAADGERVPKRAVPPIRCPNCGFHVDVPPNHSCFKPFYHHAT